MIRENCRARFTAADFDFILRTLARSQNEHVSLVDLLADSETRDSILDSPRLVDAILSHGGQLRISSQFYFYVLARHVLRDAGITDRKLCDYVGSLLEKFSRVTFLQAPHQSGSESSRQYISDMLIALSRATPEEAFLLRAYVGNYLEDCIIDHVRSAQLSKLAGASVRELSELARTFLRHAGDQLYVGIYYSRWLIDQLERHDPRAGLGDHNIRSLIVFVEEINHALHAALQFKNGQHEIGSEDFARDLELQAQVDTYLVLLLFVAFFRKTQRVSRADRRWLRFHLFARQRPEAFRDQNLRGRYLETCELAAS